MQNGSQHQLNETNDVSQMVLIAFVYMFKISLEART